MIDSANEVSGQNACADGVTLAATLAGRILHSPHAHARILSIDCSAAEQLAGVKAVLTGRNVPVKRGIGPMGHGEVIFAFDKVRYTGDIVAAVAAESEALAEKALRLIQVDYEILPAWLDPEESMRAEDSLIYEGRPHNIEKEDHHQFGDVERGFADADYIREDRFESGPAAQAALEPHSTVARYDADADAITVWSSTQAPRDLTLALASILQVPEEKVRVIQTFAGGESGGKTGGFAFELAAAVLTRKAGQPVRIASTGEDCSNAYPDRPGDILELRTGMTRDGLLTAVEAHIVRDVGVGCSCGVTTILDVAELPDALYGVPNVKFDGFHVLTNKPARGDLGGSPALNTRFSFEQQLNKMASVLGMDPAEIRRRNSRHESA